MPDPARSTGRPNNLPVQLTGFIGRGEELAELRSILIETRLLTLTGVGGVGKTRLALQAAGELTPRFPDGVWFVALAPLTDASLIPSVTALSMDLSQDPVRPLLDRISDHLRDQIVLLVLDNCEHLVAGCAALAAHLLRACPELRILATSREALNLPGETVWPVPPLSLPEPNAAVAPEEALRTEGVRLFVQRARAARPRFTLDAANAGAVIQICRRLDGIPLAIELAAARARVLSPEEIAERLNDRFELLTAGRRMGEPRHQTLRALIDWSYELLSEGERLLFRRLSVFAGGWTLEAAEAVCAGEDIERRDVLTLLAQLVDKSLVVVTGASGGTRYGLLETLRQYAAEKLEEAGEGPDLRMRYLVWFRELAERVEPESQGPDQAGLFARLESELGNLRAALEWSKTGSVEVEEGLRLAGALMRFWWFRGHAAEGEAWLSTLLALAPTGADGHEPPRSLRAGRAAAQMALGFLAVLQHRTAEAQRHAGEALALWQELGDRRGMAFSLLRLGQAARLEGELGRAEAVLEESLALSRQLESRGLMGAVLRELGAVAQAQRDHERAQTLLAESLNLGREQGDLRDIMLVLTRLAALAIERSSLPVAHTRLYESLAVALRSGLRVGFAPALVLLACLAAMESRPARALRLAGAAASVTDALGARESLYVACLAQAEPHLDLARQALGEQAAAAAWAEGEAMTLEQALAFAREEPPAGPSLPNGLTAREFDVLRLLATGESNREIAEHLVLSPRTAGRHVASIYRKIGARRRADAVAYALHLGLNGTNASTRT